jgi:hypothetical protein
MNDTSGLMPRTWLSVEWMEINPDYRGRGFSYGAMQEAIAAFAADGVTVAIPNRQTEESKAKTLKHWIDFGFIEHNGGLVFDLGDWAPEWLVP